MLDWFTIFTKGGIVLWYFQGTALSLSPAVNSLIRSIILQERGGVNSYNHGNLTLQFKMDNELEIIYVVVYQNILKLAYIDKLLDQVHLKFRDRYKNEVVGGAFAIQMDFSHDFNRLLRSVEDEHRQLSIQPKRMKTFEESHKAEKALSTTGSKSKGTKAGKALSTTATATTEPTIKVDETKDDDVDDDEEEVEEEGGGGEVGEEELPEAESVGPNNSAISAVMKKGLVARGAGRGKGGAKNKKSGVKSSPKPGGKKKKEPTRWDGGTVSSQEAEALNYSSPPPSSSSSSITSSSAPGSITNGDIDRSMVGRMKGELKQLDTTDPSSSTTTTTTEAKNKSGGGMFSFFKNLTGGKTITREAMDPALEKMKEHLVTKNVALEIAEKLCGSVATKLEGKVVGTFTGIQSLVKSSMEESLVQILSPKRRVDILRDVMTSKENGKPYVITFCGVNGVGKSTNLAKVCFWLMENGLRVLIAGCDTFRAGAVEQLRTHTKHLNSLHPPTHDGLPQKVMLYERGYDKDAANIAMEAIQYARQQSFDVVLVDTAGRMQNNEPLMRALAKLIRVNSPDLVLFVGEALVGNEAVDQLIHFNQALVDHSDEGNHRTIDGILLTKFDTVDDKVGAAISMTYITGQPIVFVGTGQTYTDLRSLNVQAVISVLLK